MKRFHELAGLVVVAVALAGWAIPGFGQATPAKLPVADNLAPEPVLDPLAPPPASSPTSPPLPSNFATGPARTADTTQPINGVSSSQEPAVSLTWEGPANAKVGRPNDYNLTVCNTGAAPVQQVLVRVQLPAGARATDTEPKANTEGNVLWWELGTLTVKQKKSLMVRMVPDARGDLACHAWVTFTGAATLQIQAREPKLTLKVTAPEKIMVGDPATLVLLVSNPGNGTAEQVKLHVNLSEGFEHPAGRVIDLDIGNLGANEARRVQLMCTVKGGGEQKCEGIAEAQGDLRVKDRIAVNITTPRLDLDVAGPKLRYIDRKAVYTFKVTNPGDCPANNVMVQDVLPAGFKFNSASDGGRHDQATRTVSWNIGEIAPAQTKEVKLEVVAVNPGEHHHKVTAQAARGLKVDNDILTRVDGVSSLLLEVMDSEDPIEVGAETSYEIRITNTGSKPETNIKLVGILPEKVQFKSATGPTRFQENGKEIAFEPLPNLAPKGDAIYRITVKAMAAGDVRFKAQITSTNLVEPVIEMESTRIYED
jgi:uncharacterized repeat protein (TIGR01451 family)